MNTRTAHLVALTGKLLSAVLAIVATAVFCYFLLHPAVSLAPAPSPAPAPLGPAATTAPSPPASP